MERLAVVALGGNALLKSGQKGNIDEALANAAEATGALVDFVKLGYNLVLTHGNGPQVGNILLNEVAGAEKNGSPLLPLDVLVAYSQGYIGYLLERTFRSHLQQNEIEKNIVSIISQILVDKNDVAFRNLTKPIGPYYTREEAQQKAKATGDTYSEDPRGRGWRKVVASPRPKEIINHKLIGQLARSGNIVIAAGGGGIPVVRDGNNWSGAEAVIDKDLASALLAKRIDADELIILTDIDKVYINFNTPAEMAIDTMTVAEAKKYIADGQFSKGSMEPKIKGCIEFVEATGKVAVIGQADDIGKKNFGTRITLN